MHEVKAINPIAQKDWDGVLVRTPGSSFFHTASWAEVLQESYNYTPLYMTIQKQEAIEALIPLMEVDSFLTGKRGVSLPFTDYCEPIASDAAEFDKLFDAAVGIGKKRRWKYLELRGGETFLRKTEASEWYYTHTIALHEIKKASNDQYLTNFSDSTRRNIKKAEQKKLKVTVSTSLDALNIFCRLNALTRRWHGLPPQPYRFFQSLHNHILSRDMGFIVCASLSGTVIAANVYFIFGDQILYKYGASDRAFQHLRANNLIMWEAIRWGCNHNYQTICLGRTEPDNEGLRHFKLGWGAQERIVRYYRYDPQKNACIKAPRIIGPSHKKIFSQLPIPILTLLGRLYYRHMG